MLCAETAFDVETVVSLPTSTLKKSRGGNIARAVKNDDIPAKSTLSNFKVSQQVDIDSSKQILSYRFVTVFSLCRYK